MVKSSPFLPNAVFRQNLLNSFSPLIGREDSLVGHGQKCGCRDLNPSLKLGKLQS